MQSHKGHWRRNGRPAQAAFFLLAISLHIAVLYMPISRFNAAQEPDRAPVELFLTPVFGDKPAMSVDETPAEQPPGKQGVPMLPAELPDTETANSVLSTAADHPVNQQAVPTVSTGLLLRQAAELKPPGGKAPAFTLGIPSHPKLPANLSQPVLPRVETMFTAAYLPSQRQILDQWQDPEGTVRAVIRLPNGMTVCGSQQQWDPFNPLFEPVAMYRLCAGGGRRSP